jgi:hypothetical protein
MNIKGCVCFDVLLDLVSVPNFYTKDPLKIIKGLVFPELNQNFKSLSNPWCEERSYFISHFSLFVPYTLPYSFISLSCSESHSLVIFHPLVHLYKFLISLGFPSKSGSHNVSGFPCARGSVLVSSFLTQMTVFNIQMMKFISRKLRCSG